MTFSRNDDDDDAIEGIMYLCHGNVRAMTFSRHNYDDENVHLVQLWSQEEIRGTLA
jgi:hypothetical protein